MEKRNRNLNNLHFYRKEIKDFYYVKQIQISIKRKQEKNQHLKQKMVGDGGRGGGRRHLDVYQEAFERKI